MYKYLSIFLLGAMALLSGFVLCQDHQIAQLERTLDQTETQVGTISGELSDIPPLAKAVTRLEAGVVTLAQRQPDSTVVVTTRYIPVEGSSEVTFIQGTTVAGEIERLVAQIQALKANPTTDSLSTELLDLQQALDSLYLSLYIPTLTVEDHGFCVVPAVGLESALSSIEGDENELSGTLGARLYYYNRFGGGLELRVPLNDETFWPPTLLGVVDYRLPWVQNAAPKFGIGYDFDTEGLRLAAGVNFLLK